MLSTFQLSRTARYFTVVAALLGATAVMLGAYASHGLSSWASSQQVSQVQLAVQYQLLHAITLLFVSFLSTSLVKESLSKRMILFSLWCYTLGIICFSGSLYYLVFVGSKLLVLITPIGGLLLIIAWLCLGIAMLFKQK